MQKYFPRLFSFDVTKSISPIGIPAEFFVSKGSGLSTLLSDEVEKDYYLWNYIFSLMSLPQKWFTILNDTSIPEQKDTTVQTLINTSEKNLKQSASQIKFKKNYVLTLSEEDFFQKEKLRLAAQFPQIPYIRTLCAIDQNFYAVNISFVDLFGAEGYQVLSSLSGLPFFKIPNYSSAVGVKYCLALNEFYNPYIYHNSSEEHIRIDPRQKYINDEQVDTIMNFPIMYLRQEFPYNIKNASYAMGWASHASNIVIFNFGTSANEEIILESLRSFIISLQETCGLDIIVICNLGSSPDQMSYALKNKFLRILYEYPNEFYVNLTFVPNNFSPFRTAREVADSAFIHFQIFSSPLKESISRIIDAGSSFGASYILESC